MAPKNLKYASLCDIYGGLLSDKQRDAMEMYYCDDLSLSEIAVHMGITRQGVRDQIKHAEEELDRFEEKLGLTEYFERNASIIDILEQIKATAGKYSESSCGRSDIDKRIAALCDEAAKIIESL